MHDIDRPGCRGGDPAKSAKSVPPSSLTSLFDEPSGESFSKGPPIFRSSWLFVARFVVLCPHYDAKCRLATRKFFSPAKTKPTIFVGAAFGKNEANRQPSPGFENLWMRFPSTKATKPLFFGINEVIDGQIELERLRFKPFSLVCFPVADRAIGMVGLAEARLHHKQKQFSSAGQALPDETKPISTRSQTCDGISNRDEYSRPSRALAWASPGKDSVAASNVSLRPTLCAMLPR